MGVGVEALPLPGPIRSRSREPWPLHEGDELTLRKSHACGGNRWRILRVGADVRIRCCACGRILWLPRAQLEARIRQIHPAQPPPPPPLP